MKFSFLLAACTSLVAFATPALSESVFTVQLGSFDSEQKAADHWQTISGKYDRQLGALSPNISSLTLPPDNVTSYRIQAGPLNAIEDARDICSALQAQQDRCFVVETAMFSPSELPTFAEAPDVEPVITAPELPFDPERSAENIASTPVAAPDIDSTLASAVDVAAAQSEQEAAALSDEAAEQVGKNNSLLSRLNPFSSNDPTPAPPATTFNEEQNKARLALNDSLNTAPPVDEYADITSVSNEEVIRKREELEDARRKLNDIKTTDIQSAPTAFSQPIELETPTLETPVLETTQLEAPAVEVIAPNPEVTIPEFTPPKVTTQAPVALVTPAQPIQTAVVSAPTSQTPGVLGTLNGITTQPIANVAAPRVAAPEVAFKAPMLDVEPANASVTTNEQVLATLQQPSQNTVSAPYIPPIAPRYVPNVSPVPANATIQSPQRSAPRLSAPEPTIIVPTVTTATPQTPGVLGTLSSQPSTPLKNNDVTVSEAIRVPLTTRTAPAAPVVLAPVTAAPALKDVRYLDSPSRVSNKGNIWTEINTFESREAAMAYWQEFSRLAVSARPLRVRVTQPFKQAEGIQRVSLKAGPFESHASASALCQNVNLQKYSCTTRELNNTSASAPVPGASRILSRTNARDRRNAYEAKRGYSASGRTLKDQGYWVQLGAYPSGERAAASWSQLQTQYAPALDGMHPHIVEPHLGSHQQPTFRLRAGPYLAHSVARDVCAQIKAKRGLCLVTRQ